MLKMTVTQQNLYNVLFDNQDQVVSHMALAKVIWGSNTKKFPACWRAALFIEIGHIRRALGHQRWQIVNVYGRGYTFGCKVKHYV